MAREKAVLVTVLSPVADGDDKPRTRAVGLEELNVLLDEGWQVHKMTSGGGGGHFSALVILRPPG